MMMMIVADIVRASTSALSFIHDILICKYILAPSIPRRLRSPICQSYLPSSLVQEKVTGFCSEPGIRFDFALIDHNVR